MMELPIYMNTTPPSEFKKRKSGVYAVVTKGNHWVRLYVYKVQAETEKALYCRFGGSLTAWIPKRQMHDGSEVLRQGDIGSLTVSVWLAKQKGLI